MLLFLILCGCGLVWAGIYTVRAQAKDRHEKLKRIQNEIARREALEENENREI